MTALLEVEIRRALARRLVRVTAIVLAVGIALTGVILFAKSTKTDAPPEPAHPGYHQCLSGDLGAGTLYPPYNSMPEEQRAEFDRQLPPNSPERRQFCQGMYGGSVSSETFELRELGGILTGTSGTFVIIALLFGASLIAAEWRAGTLATQLTWEPRRLHLALAKLLGAIIVTVGLYFVMQAVLALVLWIVAVTRGSTAGMGVEQARELIGQELRLGLLMAFVTTGGFAIGLVGKNTAASLGVAFGYLIIFEQMLQRLEWLVPWLILPNVAAFVSGGDIAFRGRTSFEAGLILAIYAGGLLLGALWMFRTRDALT